MRETSVPQSASRFRTWRTPLALAVVGLLGVTSWVLQSSAQSEMPEPVFPTAPTGRGPVVLELFTSQGCSSCPPAEDLLPALAEHGDAPVIPLAYHVDYWDRLGWEDPFADREWTQRQEQYCDALGARSVYTPQLVVNGQSHATGSDAPRIRRLVRQARVYEPVGRPSITLHRSGRDVNAEIAVDVLDADRTQDVDVIAVLFERRHATSVTAGENAGRTLHEDYVVRDLKRVMNLAKAETLPRTVSFRLPEEGRNLEVGVAVLLQDAKSRAILGAAADSVAPPEDAAG